MSDYEIVTEDDEHPYNYNCGIYTCGKGFKKGEKFVQFLYSDGFSKIEVCEECLEKIIGELKNEKHDNIARS